MPLLTELEARVVHGHKVMSSIGRRGLQHRSARRHGGTMAISHFQLGAPNLLVVSATTTERIRLPCCERMMSSQRPRGIRQLHPADRDAADRLADLTMGLAGEAELHDR